MNFTSRTLTGLAMIIIASFLISFSLSSLMTLIYGIPILLIGTFIFFNKKEDIIERIKWKK